MFGAVVLINSCVQEPQPLEPSKPSIPGSPLSPQSRRSDEKIRVFCQQCHPLVAPVWLPKEAWPDVIMLMYRYAGSLETGQPRKERRRDLVNIATHSPYKLSPEVIPDYNAVMKYYLENSIPAARYIRPMDAPDVDETAQWGSSSRWNGPSDGSPPAIAHLEIASLKKGEPPVLLAADMLGGRLVRAELGGNRADVIATLKHPVHFVVVDWNGDGLQDLVVAELGSLLGRDITDGKVTLLQQEPNGQFSSHVLADEVGRAAHIAVGDLDGDEDLDFAVAEFGMMATGSLFVLLNEGSTTVPQFEKVILDERPGFLDVHIVDIDGDGEPNVVGVIAQHYEQVMSYALTKSGGCIERESWTGTVLSGANDPGWGSTNSAIADLDGDNDLDIVWLNGDTMDSETVKASQGVYWLENKGTTFELHFITYLPGAHKVHVVDMDGDKDSDLLISSAYYIEEDVLRPDNAPSVAWLEKVENTYKLHTIEVGQNRHFTMAVANVDADSQAEIVVGNSYLSFSKPPGAAPQPREASSAWFTLFDKKP